MASLEQKVGVGCTVLGAIGVATTALACIAFMALIGAASGDPTQASVPQVVSPAPAATTPVSAEEHALLPLPHPHAHCAWLLPPALGDLQLVEIHSSGVVSNTEFYEYGPHGSSMPIRVEANCEAWGDLPSASGEVVNAEGVALYVRSSGVIEGWTAGTNPETVPVELAFERVTSVAPTTRAAAFVVSAVPARLQAPHREMRAHAIAAARRLAAFVQTRASGAYDDRAVVEHWNSLLETLHAAPAQRQWMLRSVEAYDAAMRSTESSYFASAQLEDAEPLGVSVRFTRDWEGLPAQEQARRIAFLRGRWVNTREVPVPNVRSGRWQPLGPYDPRPFDTQLVFVDFRGRPVTPGAVR